MSQMNRVLNVLERNVASPGVTVSRLAKDARLPKASVSKRISELRSEGFRIFTNYRKIGNQKKTYYRLAR